MPIRVFLISNFQLLSQCLATLIKSAPKVFTLTGVADSVAHAHEDIDNKPVDVVLLDIDGSTNGLTALIADLRACTEAKILLLTRMDNHTLEDQAIVAGARGLIDRDSTCDTLLTALQKIHEGQVWLNRDATGRIFVEFSRLGANHPHEHHASKSHVLTERERHIVATMTSNSGKPGKVIAETIHISESTLRNHLTSIYEKLGVSNRHGLQAYAFQNGLVK